MIEGAFFWASSGIRILYFQSWNSMCQWNASQK